MSWVATTRGIDADLVGDLIGAKAGVTRGGSSRPAATQSAAAKKERESRGPST